MKIKVEIWNIFVVSMLLMLVNAAMNPACALMNTALEDSNTPLTSKLGYISQSIMSLVSILGSIMAPPLRALVGNRILMVVAALLHVAFYMGMIVLDEFAVLFGSVIAGFGMGIIWVAIPNFVTITSKHEHIERNLSYHMFIYNFNGVAGNILNYFCLDDSTAITDSSRIRYYTVCIVMTMISVVVGGLAICSPETGSQLSTLNDEADIRLIPDDVPDSTSDSDNEHNIPISLKIETHPWTVRGFTQRCRKFMAEPGVRALTVSNCYFGAATTLILIVPMCISNTYENRHLIPILGGTIGVCRMTFTGFFDWTARVTGYKFIVYLHTATAFVWVIVVFLVFPDNSLHSKTPGESPILPVDDWVVYLLGFLTGGTLTWLGVLVTVATGKVSTDTQSMHGFDPDVLFAYTMIIWSISSSVSLAITPYVSLYLFACLIFVGILCNHIAFSNDLLSFVGVYVIRDGGKAIQKLT